MLKRLIILSGAVLCGSFILTACEKDNIVPDIPQGQKTITGLLKPAEISLVRRGTHILEADGLDLFFVESRDVSLRNYENRIVTMSGSFIVNADPSDLPVFVAKSIELEEVDTRQWTSRDLMLSFEYPAEWSESSEDGTFYFTSEGSEKSVLTIYAEMLETPPSGFPILLGNAQGLRAIDESLGRETITIERDEDYVILLFHPSGEDQPLLKQQWLSLLRSLNVLKSDSDDDPDTSTGSVTDSGIPCGGTAGILCPEGHYCDVTDLQENIGKCRGVK